MSEPTPAHRLAEAGRCACGAKVVRGLDQDGHLATAEVVPLDAAAELIAHHHGVPTYAHTLARPRGQVLTRRTPTDLVRRPVGFRHTRVLGAHLCPQETP